MNMLAAPPPVAWSDASATYAIVQWTGLAIGAVFIFAFGAIVGSFLNVVVYRVPKGIGLVSPPSSCPSCSTRLTWHENFPILGWLWLRGRCRFCKSPISPEYPIVETFTASTFALLFLQWFGASMAPVASFGRAGESGWLGVWQSWSPHWAGAGLALMWPMLAMTFGLIACLIAVTLIDARTYTIPLSIPWFATLIGLVGHPVHALVVSRIAPVAAARMAERAPWTIPTPKGPLLAAALAGGIGIAISSIAVALGWMKRSFHDYEAWEASRADGRDARPTENRPFVSPDTATTDTAGDSLSGILLRVLALTLPAVALMFVGTVVSVHFEMPPMPGLLVGMVVGLVIGFILRNYLASRSAGPSTGPVWLEYPHARREVARELLFLAPCILLAAVAWWLATPRIPPGTLDQPEFFQLWLANPPLWLRGLGGSVLGYLVGGGIVWSIRILGTLGVGQEAMGLGDVHLMAAVGAVLGWVDPVAAFIIAPLSGLGWTLSVWVTRRMHGKTGQSPALPYGPHLAAATLLVIFLHPALAHWLDSFPGGGLRLP